MLKSIENTPPIIKFLVETVMSIESMSRWNINIGNVAKSTKEH